MADVGKREEEDIKERVDRILKDLGNPEPPIPLDDVRELLRLDLQFYNTDDPSTIDEIVHKMKVGGKQLFSRPTLLLDVIKKANISALWIPDSKRIMLDENLPGFKYRCRWMEAHEISHSIIPWHQDFLFGDNELTLDPACHDMIEGEANYGAGRLLFLQDRFAQEAREIDLNFRNIKKMAARYGNTITSTLWRIVEDRSSETPTFGMISQHPKYPNADKFNAERPWKHFMHSEGFLKQFSNVVPENVYARLEENSNWCRGGTVIDCEVDFNDINGDLYSFRIESFSNRHTLLTYGVLLRKVEFVISIG